MVLSLFDPSCTGPPGNWDAVTGMRCARTAALLMVAIYVTVIAKVDTHPLFLLMAPAVYMLTHTVYAHIYKTKREEAIA